MVNIKNILEFPFAHIKRQMCKPLSISKIMFAVTYNCNSRCNMCNIWKRKSKNELSTKEIKNFFLKNKKLLKDLKVISLTGGEPFLRKDLVEIVRIIANFKKEIHIHISTNGLLTERIIKYVKEIKKITNHFDISVSIDGTKEMHEKIRGILGCFDKSMNTLKKLKNLGIGVSLGLTASPMNYKEITKVRSIAREEDVPFTFQIVNITKDYFSNLDRNIDFAKLDIKELQRMIMNKNLSLSERFINYGCIEYAKNKGKMLFSCFAGFNSFFLDPYGNAYVCAPDKILFGNIREKSLEEIWFSKEAKIGRKKVRDGRCVRCWLLCQIEPSIKYNLHKILIKYLQGKI